jgi:hypothetical protein
VQESVLLRVLGGERHAHRDARRLDALEARAEARS